MNCLVAVILFFAIGWNAISASTSSAAEPVTTVMLSGMPAPGVAGGDTFGSTTTHSVVALNNDGQVAFFAPLAGADVTSSTTDALWAGAPGGLQLLAREGDVVSTSLGNAAWSFPTTPKTPTINSAGQVLFEAGLTGNTTNSAIAVGSLGHVDIAAIVGTAAPGTPAGTNFATGGSGGFIDSYAAPVMNNAGQVAFSSLLKGGGATSANNSGVWSGAADNLGLVVREGDSAPGMPVGSVFQGPGGAQENAFSISSINDSGQVAFVASVFTPTPSPALTSGIWTGTQGNLSLLVRAGDSAPGTAIGVTFTGLTNSDIAPINNAGQVAFYSLLTGPGVTTTNDDGIWVGTPGHLELAIRAGDQAPGLPIGVKFTEPDFASSLTLPAPPFINAQGKVLVEGGFSGAGLFSAHAFWVGQPGELKLVAYVGEQAVGFPLGVTYGLPPNSGFAWNPWPTMNALGQVALISTVSTGDVAIWATDLAGALELIVKKGDSLEVAPGDFRTVQDLYFSGSGTNSGGLPTGFNDIGQIAFWASFTDGTSGVFISNAVAVPEPSTLALATLGSAVAAFRYRRRRAV